MSSQPILLYAAVFISSVLLLFWSGSKLVKALMKIARYLGWREFVVAFFVMAIASSIPNLFVGINSAVNGIPELSFGDIVGGNIVDLTLAVALVVLIGGRNLPARTKIIQNSALFTAGIALLPLILILDGSLGRIDGLVLILVFKFYVLWLFSREDRFRKAYGFNHNHNNNGAPKKEFRRFIRFLKNLAKVVILLVLLLLASEGIVRSARVFSETLDVSISMVGILIIGLGSALPETYFAIASARKNQTDMILGDLIGSVIVCATLILGIVALIRPIEITDFSPFAIARIFLIVSALFFLTAIKTGKKITKKEALVLLALYIIFVLSETCLK